MFYVSLLRFKSIFYLYVNILIILKHSVFCMRDISSSFPQFLLLILLIMYKCLYKRYYKRFLTAA